VPGPQSLSTKLAGMGYVDKSMYLAARTLSGRISTTADAVRFQVP
jgi:hypothetical protein